ncbi:MAG TPA: YbhB/YbcL family Raf kinase inhibitor-like protein [Candidatus Hydrogenedentes bacterium]|nr:YbhB/YbcL family Raf kinase inhibitor-like protein [Candidatus Hydrogenedentota bacterium]
MRTRSFRYFGRMGGTMLCCLALAWILHGVSPVAAITQGDSTMNFQISSTAFKQGEYIPKKHTGEGPDLSPALQWANPPAGVKSFALICDDPDAPVGTWVHWVIFNIPASAAGLPEGVPTNKELKDGARQGTNDFRKIGYGGPMPPRGSDHRYFFKLYALDLTLAMNSGVKKADVLKAMENHILGQAELMGRYKR